MLTGECGEPSQEGFGIRCIGQSNGADVQRHELLRPAILVNEIRAFDLADEEGHKRLAVETKEVVVLVAVRTPT